MTKKKRQKIQDVYKLSPMQSGMLFHFLMDKEGGAYSDQLTLSLKGEISPSLLEKSFNLLIERHDILRTVFRFENVKEPLQIVLKQRRSSIDYRDISPYSGAEQKTYLEEFKTRDRQRGFDLGRDLLLRIGLVKTGRDTYTLVLSSHHIIIDGWCIGIIYKDLHRLYRFLKEGETPRLEPPTPYRKYIDWLEKQDTEEGLRYWEGYLDGYAPPTSLLEWGKPPGDNSYNLVKHTIIIAGSIKDGLENITRENQVTMSTLSQSIWGILLQKYLNTNDVVFGSVVSGRPSDVEGIEGMVGLFINTMPVRIRLGAKGEQTEFLHLVKEVQRDAVLSKSFEYLSLADIQSKTSLKTRPIDHIVGFKNYPVQEETKDISNQNSAGFRIEKVESYDQTHFHFGVTISLRKNLLVKFSFNSRVYEIDFVKRLASHFKEMARQVVDNPLIEVGKIEILGKEEKNRLLKKVKTNKSINKNVNKNQSGPATLEAVFDF